MMATMTTTATITPMMMTTVLSTLAVLEDASVAAGAEKHDRCIEMARKKHTLSGWDKLAADSFNVLGVPEVTNEVSVGAV
jgi:hypothetical protein